jgi:hypothetical protein
VHLNRGHLESHGKMSPAECSDDRSAMFAVVAHAKRSAWHTTCSHLESDGKTFLPTEFSKFCQNPDPINGTHQVPIYRVDSRFSTMGSYQVGLSLADFAGQKPATHLLRF